MPTPTAGAWTTSESSLTNNSSMPRPIALVTAATARDLDTDLPYLVRAFADRGVTAELIDWDTADEDWTRFSSAVIRSPWDYHRRFDEFRAWLERVSSLTTVQNPVDVIRWNLDKRYLAEMTDAGLETIPTTWIASDADIDTADDSFDGDIVVKPTVSAGANNSWRHTADRDGAIAHAREILGLGKSVMLQPYQRFIDDRGETGMVYFAGEYSHAFRKGPILTNGAMEHNDLYVEEEIAARKPTEQERELGDAVLEFLARKFGRAPLYARVDVVKGWRGVPVLMEVELAEPSFFLHVAPGAAERFVGAVLAR